MCPLITITGLQLIHVVGGNDTSMGNACVQSYMKTEPDGSGSGVSAVDRREEYFSAAPGEHARRGRARLIGMDAAIKDHKSKSHSLANANVACGVRAK